MGMIGSGSVMNWGVVGGGSGMIGGGVVGSGGVVGVVGQGERQGGCKQH